jgi:polyphenol oxidase
MAEALTADLLPAPHGFFTRRGGVSEGPYASLNCSLSSQDDRAAVLENRARVARSLGTEPNRLLGLTQVHGIHVVTATEAWAAGQGEKADAMVTDRPGLALGIITADCAPVLFADAGGKIVGAAHAGWRGAVAGVLEATLAAMTALGASPDGITAAVGPCIAAESYEVGATRCWRDRRPTRRFSPRDGGRVTGNLTCRVTARPVCVPRVPATSS